MRLILASSLLLVSCTAIAQREDLGWIAPEGKILNYRTLTWSDFQQHEDKEFANKLKAQNLQAAAYVCPAIYYTADSGYKQENGRLKFKFHVKCAFQSHAFVRESTKQEKSNYVLIHEQDHYDIALNYANILYAELSSKDYSTDKYKDELHKIYHDINVRYNALQEQYDGEVNPHGTDNVPMQTLWDMRIKKCLENSTEQYYASPEPAVQSVKAWGQTVKRLPSEDKRRFITRARPLYTEVTDELAGLSLETAEFTAEKSVVAFFLQRYFVPQEDKPTKECSRLLAYIFIPNGKDTYKRTFIDTFCYKDQAPKISAVFFANSDSDNVKELIIHTTADQKDKEATGKHYFTRAYDNLQSRALPARLKKVPLSPAIEVGFEGTLNGKPQKAPAKNQKEITEALIKLGFAG